MQNIEDILEKYSYEKNFMGNNNINKVEIEMIYQDYQENRDSYESQIEFIANILRSNSSVHSVKARIKKPERLIEKIMRKTFDRREKYGNNFNFTVENYKNEINDIIGVRVIHIFKSEWEEIDKFIRDTWNVIETTANVRDGDDTSIFNEKNIEVRSRQSGYRSVHYLVELNYILNSKIIAEIQVRTIFEEGYGEIDHRLRYSNTDIPEIIKSNLLLFNRIIGSADEMASLISSLNNEFNKELYYENKINKQNEKIIELKKELEQLKSEK